LCCVVILLFLPFLVHLLLHFLQVPVRLFKGELAGAIQNQNQLITFELRQDNNGNQFFGIRQPNGALWLNASSKVIDDDEEDGIVEFVVDDGEVPPGVEPKEAIALERVHFDKLEPILTNLNFSSVYLNKFVENITSEFIWLKLSPPEKDENGELGYQPCIIEYSPGKQCNFTFMLAPATPDT